MFCLDTDTFVLERETRDAKCHALAEIVKKNLTQGLDTETFDDKDKSAAKNAVAVYMGAHLAKVVARNETYVPEMDKLARTVLWEELAKVYEEHEEDLGVVSDEKITRLEVHVQNAVVVAFSEMVF